MTVHVPVLTAAEIEKMRIAGKLAADVLDMIGPHVVPGVTTLELDNIMHDYIVNTQEAIPACLNYQGYPKNTCISVNEEVCHGIPGAKHLHKGDIVNIDVTVIKDDFYGDTSRMYIVGGETSPRNRPRRTASQLSATTAVTASAASSTRSPRFFISGTATTSLSRPA